MAIIFHQENVDILLNNKENLKLFILQLFDNESIKVENLIYIFCTDAFLLSLNKTYLNHDTYTDILTFDLSETPGELTADIYISTERVKENAALYGDSFEKEIHRVIFHGALHLCGYNDHTDKEKKMMRKKENEYLHSYFSNSAS